ncbi:hypothetical protein BATDEDRAFT_29385 [Batrachochytrium dendrobatidis JAM81]|uniref:Asparagine synthetase domain-containing protein n=1 Tax=Batrachochytrium dendrobatidis (strain JAM81 / FGSC 10211) TaxID=684364 RepID=F4NUI0_BATDJ|nr:uncharacterized protein BATDEDRAFT_29385 [Batrachochytrium dendrobatidis JAM81]EGF83610.1 hypothetical protein BATDEDRAFT_29385 [Batrachochytrium dendrobatidis JAM81]|eukprot:XP_006675640.1 hypothetical protein BATDEDRAFT_29385 [Batrachochytrium dendrobatidis JAM81]
MPAPQPMIDLHGNYLCFNGQVFGGLHVPLDSNDTTMLSSQLAIENLDESHILKTLSEIHGEWAIVFYHKRTNCVYFGRDHLGRRSLLMHLPTHPQDTFILSSVEVPTTGLFVVDLALVNTAWNDPTQYFRHISWSTSSDPLTNLIPSDLDLGSIDQTDPRIGLSMIDDASPMNSAVKSLESVLANAVRTRTENIPAPIRQAMLLLKRFYGNARLGILFSGGLDCITLAALAHRIIPPMEPIDLLNVGFENPRIAQHKNKTTLKKNVDNLKDEPPLLLASNSFDVPDRLTGRLGATELQQLFPSREWRFVCINVPYTEVVACQPYIMNLMTPLNTSIAMAFWFASRGIGTILDQNGAQNVYHSHAKVLLSGLGADEQLGGYGRHKAKFNALSWEGLITELQLDVSRISTRNLGRDDRIISSHGKEARFPFLDRNVVSLLCQLPIHLKTDPRKPKGVGDKLVLRLVAKGMGLDRAAIEPKRAVQFGARTAKMESGKQSGKDVLNSE